MVGRRRFRPRYPATLEAACILRSVPPLTILDKFPAKITFADGQTADPAYIYAHDGRVRVWVEDGKGGVEKLADDAFASIFAADGIAKLDAADGSWTVENSPQGCGCGSPLKTFNPRRSD